MTQGPLNAGQDDPDDHIQNHESLMMLHGEDAKNMSQAFSLTLSGHSGLGSIVYQKHPSPHLSSCEQSSPKSSKLIVGSERMQHISSVSNKGAKRPFANLWTNSVMPHWKFMTCQWKWQYQQCYKETHLTSLQESLSLDPPNSLAYLFVKENKYILHAEVMQTVRIDEDRE